SFSPHNHRLKSLPLTAQRDYNLSRANHAPDLHAEFFTKIKPSYFCIFCQVTRHTRSKNLSFSHDVRAIRNAQSLANIVIRNEDSDSTTAQIKDHALNIVDGLWIDAGKRLVEQDKLWLSRQSSRDFGAAPFTTGQ